MCGKNTREHGCSWHCIVNGLLLNGPERGVFYGPGQHVVRRITVLFKRVLPKQPGPGYFTIDFSYHTVLSRQIFCFVAGFFMGKHVSGP